MARSKTQPAIPGRRFAAKVASPVIIGTAASFASVHTTGRARISTPADAANARANYAAIDCVIAANGWQIPDEALSTIRNPIKSGFKTGITSLRGWRWIRLPGEDDDWQLLNREGKQVARIRQEGELYWVSHPSRLPEPPLEGLGPANMRAELLALWTLEPWSVRAPRLSAKQRALLTAIIRRDHAPINLLGGYCFESTPALDQELVKTIRQMESCLGEPLPTASSPPFVPTWTPSARRFFGIWPVMQRCWPLPLLTSGRAQRRHCRARHSWGDP